MKKKYGFTLIELLAVIVVLAIIALIATPIVTNVIEKSKKGTAIESGNNLIHSAEIYFMTTSPRYGKIDVLDPNLNYNGKKPELGEVEITKEGKTRIYAYINGYCVTKEYETETYASKTSKDNCNWYGTDNYETQEGTIFTLNNQKVKNYLIYGNSTQQTRSGKNLFNPSAWSTSATVSGLTFQYLEDEDCFLINGTATSVSEKVAKYINIPSAANKSYVLSTQYVSGSVDRTNGEGDKWAVAYFGNGDTTNTTNNWYAIDLQNEDSVTTARVNGKNYITRFWFYVSKGVTFNNYKVRIQLEEGSSATGYEKYGAMPSPEYPSEIKSTGDLITSSNCSSYGSDACNNIGKYVIQIKSAGKNLFDINTAEKNKGLVWRSGLYYNLDKSVASDFIQIKNNVNYVSKYNMQVILYDKDFNYINSLDESNPRKSFVITDQNCKYIKVAFRPSDNLQQDLTSTEDIMLEESNKVTEYESYREPITANIYLDEPLRKVGDYADYIDFGNKKVVRNVKEEILKGNENLNHWLYEGKNVGFYLIKSIAKKYAQISSNYFISSSNIPQNNNYVGVYDEIYFRTQNWAKSDDFKSWIVEKNNENKPLIIYYILATPTETSINLPNIETLDGNTTLFVNSDTQPSNIKLTTTK